MKKRQAEHLLATLEMRYPGKVKANWSPDTYLGINIRFSENRRAVTLSMDGYIAKSLQRFHNPLAATPSPIIYDPPSYGKKVANFSLRLRTAL